MFGGSDVPVLAKKVNLVVGVDASFEVERQMKIQQVCRRTGPRYGAFFSQGHLPGRIRAAASAAANGGILALRLAVEHDLCGGITAGFFVSRMATRRFLQGAKVAFDLAFGLGAGSDQR